MCSHQQNALDFSIFTEEEKLLHRYDDDICNTDSRDVCSMCGGINDNKNDNLCKICRSIVNDKKMKEIDNTLKRIVILEVNLVLLNILKFK